MSRDHPADHPARTYTASLPDDVDTARLVAWATSHPDQCPLRPEEVSRLVWARPWTGGRGSPASATVLLRRVRRLAALAGWVEVRLLGALSAGAAAFIPATSTWTGPPPNAPAATVVPTEGPPLSRDYGRVARWLASAHIGPHGLLLADLLAAVPMGPPEARSVQTRAGRILHTLGWRRVRTRLASADGSREHRYLPPMRAPIGTPRRALPPDQEPDVTGVAPPRLEPPTVLPDPWDGTALAPGHEPRPVHRNGAVGHDPHGLAAARRAPRPPTSIRDLQRLIRETIARSQADMKQDT